MVISFVEYRTKLGRLIRSHLAPTFARCKMPPWDPWALVLMVVATATHRVELMPHSNAVPSILRLFWMLFSSNIELNIHFLYSVLSIELEFTTCWSRVYPWEPQRIIPTTSLNFPFLLISPHITYSHYPLLSWSPFECRPHFTAILWA